MIGGCSRAAPSELPPTPGAGSGPTLTARSWPEFNSAQLSGNTTGNGRNEIAEFSHQPKRNFPTVCPLPAKKKNRLKYLVL